MDPDGFDGFGWVGTSDHQFDRAGVRSDVHHFVAGVLSIFPIMTGIKYLICYQ